MSFQISRELMIAAINALAAQEQEARTRASKMEGDLRRLITAQAERVRAKHDEMVRILKAGEQA